VDWIAIDKTSNNSAGVTLRNSCINLKFVGNCHRSKW